MDGIAKAMILLVIMGMLIYGLGVKAFSADTSASPIPQSDSLENEPTTDVGDSYPAYSEQLAELERIQEDIDYQLSQIEIERENLASSRVALENNWADLYSEKESLSISQAALDSEKVKIAQEWDKIAIEQTILSEAQTKLEQLIVELDKKEKGLTAKQVQLTTEMNRLQDKIADLNRTKSMFYALAVVLVIATTAAIMFSYFHNIGKLNIVSNEMVEDLLYKIPVYRKLAIRKARKREIQNNINALRNKTAGLHTPGKGNGRENEEIFVKEDVLMVSY